MGLLFRLLAIPVLVVVFAICFRVIPRSLVVTVVNDSVYLANEVKQYALAYVGYQPRTMELYKIASSVDDITDEQIRTASQLVVMVYGLRGRRHQFDRHVQLLRASDPNALILVPSLYLRGNAPIDVVLEKLMTPIVNLIEHKWDNTRPITLMGISNGARMVLHALVKHHTSKWPLTTAILIVGPLNGTNRIQLIRQYLPIWMRSYLPYYAEALDEMEYNAPHNQVIIAQARRLKNIEWHFYASHWDWCVSPVETSVLDGFENATKFVSQHHGHTSLADAAADLHVHTILNNILSKTLVQSNS
jgi:hypothetical protein